MNQRAWAQSTSAGPLPNSTTHPTTALTDMWDPFPSSASCAARTPLQTLVGGPISHMLPLAPDVTRPPGSLGLLRSAWDIKQELPGLHTAEQVATATPAPASFVVCSQRRREREIETPPCGSSSSTDCLGAGADLARWGSPVLLGLLFGGRHRRMGAARGTQESLTGHDWRPDPGEFLIGIKASSSSRVFPWLGISAMYSPVIFLPSFIRTASYFILHLSFHELEYQRRLCASRRRAQGEAPVLPLCCVAWGRRQGCSRRFRYGRFKIESRPNESVPSDHRSDGGG